MPPDDLLDDDVRVFLQHFGGIEVVLPEIDRATEVFRQERHQPRHERVAEDHGSRQRRVVDLGDEPAFFVRFVRPGRLDDARPAWPDRTQREVGLPQHTR
jgi:hypothetical protein